MSTQARPRAPLLHGCWHDLARLRAPLFSGREGHSPGLPGASPNSLWLLPTSGPLRRTQGPRSFYQLQGSPGAGEAEQVLCGLVR